MKEMPKCLTVSEAAEELGLSDRMVRKFIADGELKAYKTGPRGHWRILRGWLEEFLNQKAEETHADLAGLTSRSRKARAA